jgi:hypothetical protein
MRRKDKSLGDGSPDMCCDTMIGQFYAALNAFLRISICYSFTTIDLIDPLPHLIIELYFLWHLYMLSYNKLCHDYNQYKSLLRISHEHSTNLELKSRDKYNHNPFPQ